MKTKIQRVLVWYRIARLSLTEVVAFWDSSFLFSSHPSLSLDLSLTSNFTHQVSNFSTLFRTIYLVILGYGFLFFCPKNGIYYEGFMQLFIQMWGCFAVSNEFWAWTHFWFLIEENYITLKVYQNNTTLRHLYKKITLLRFVYATVKSIPSQIVVLLTKYFTF